MRFRHALVSTWTFTLSFLAAFAPAQAIVDQGRILDHGALNLVYQGACRGTDGFLYVTGVTTGPVENPLLSGEMVTQKLSEDGATVWTNTYSLPPYSMCYPDQMAVDAKGSVFVVGHATNVITNTTSMFALRISSTGTDLWAVNFGDYSSAFGLAVDSSENLYLAGASNVGVSILKLDAANGNLAWVKPQAWGTKPSCTGLAASPTGRLFALLQGGGKPSEVVSINEASGATSWSCASVPYGTFKSDTWTSMAVLSSGNVVVGGHGTAAAFDAATVDWIDGVTGGFLFRKQVGHATAPYSGTFAAAPVTDTYDNVFWSLLETDSTTKAVTESFGKFSPAGSLAWSSTIHSAGQQTLLTAAGDGGLFGSYTFGGDTRSFIRYSSAGSNEWVVSPTTSVNSIGGQISSDSKQNLSYVGASQDVYGNNSIGLSTLGAANGAVLSNGNETLAGDRFNSIGGGDQDPEGNAYVAGQENRGWFVAKISPTGQVVWRTTVPAFAAISPASSNLVCYSNGLVAAVGGGEGKVIVAKLEASTGNLLWVGSATPWEASLIPQSIKIDNSANVDVGLNDSFVNYGVMQFASNNGVLAWQHYVTADVPSGLLALNKEGDVYLAGSYTTTQSPSLSLTKLNKEGVLQFSNNKYVGSFPILTGVQCDPTTGDVFLEASDSTKVGPNTLGAYDVGRFDGSGNIRWLKTIPVSGYGFAGLADAKLRLATNSLYMVIDVGASVTGAVDYGAMRINAGSGTVIWQKVVNVPNNFAGSEPTPWCLDQYGDVIFTTPKPGATRLLDRFQIVKLDVAAGAIRFQAPYTGTLASPFNWATQATVGPDDDPLVLGYTSAAVGPGSRGAFFVKMVDAHAPICADDTYTCAKSTPLPSAAPSVFANDRDIAGATCHLLTGPTHAKTFSLSSTGSITYTPAENFTGTDTFTYYASNPYGSSNVATVTITVG